MTVEIRPCRQDEIEEYSRVVAYVFAEDSPDAMNEEIRNTSPDWTTCAFVDGRLATTMGAYPFTVRLNGNPVHMGGVTQVGTLPNYRRQGLLRKVMQQGFETMRERNQPFAILWASMAAIYQRFGYGIAADMATYEFDPRVAQFETRHEAPGSITMTTAEEAFATIKQLYIQWAGPRNMAIHRASVLWQADNLRPARKGAPVYAAVYRNADGEARGHVTYGTRNRERAAPGPGQELKVTDFIALDMEAYRALWEYLCRHDLVGTIVMPNVLPVDDPAPGLLLEPRMLQRRTQDAIWMRVVHVEKALAARPYGTRGELTVRIDGDAMCPWNDATWLIETDGPAAMVSRTDRAPDLTMRPNGLAPLISGHTSATVLHRAGAIEAADPRALTTADALFRTEYAPFTPNHF
ncbi:MAG: GNAT family N-acetyltransferase [Dehalococcoidia bacterium]